MPGSLVRTLSYGVYGIDLYQVPGELDVTIGQNEQTIFQIVGLPEGTFKGIEILPVAPIVEATAFLRRDPNPATSGGPFRRAGIRGARATKPTWAGGARGGHHRARAGVGAGGVHDLLIMNPCEPLIFAFGI